MSCDPWARRGFVPNGRISVLTLDRISVNQNEPVAFTGIDVESILVLRRVQATSGHPKGRGLQFPNSSIARLVADSISADIIETIAPLEKTVKLGLELIGGQPVSDFQGIELSLNHNEQEQGPSESEWGEELHHL